MKKKLLILSIICSIIICGCTNTSRSNSNTSTNNDYVKITEKDLESKKEEFSNNIITKLTEAYGDLHWHIDGVIGASQSAEMFGLGGTYVDLKATYICTTDFGASYKVYTKLDLQTNEYSDNYKDFIYYDSIANKLEEELSNKINLSSDQKIESIGSFRNISIDSSIDPYKHSNVNILTLPTKNLTLEEYNIQNNQSIVVNILNVDLDVFDKIAQIKSITTGFKNIIIHLYFKNPIDLSEVKFIPAEVKDTKEEGKMRFEWHNGNIEDSRDVLTIELERSSEDNSYLLRRTSFSKSAFNKEYGSALFDHVPEELPLHYED